MAFKIILLLLIIPIFLREIRNMIKEIRRKRKGKNYFYDEEIESKDGDSDYYGHNHKINILGYFPNDKTELLISHLKMNKDSGKIDSIIKKSYTYKIKLSIEDSASIKKPKPTFLKNRNFIIIHINKRFLHKTFVIIKITKGFSTKNWKIKKEYEKFFVEKGNEFLNNYTKKINDLKIESSKKQKNIEEDILNNFQNLIPTNAKRENKLTDILKNDIEMKS